MALAQNPIEKLIERAEQHPNKVYLRQPINDQWTEYTWAQVLDQARRMATALEKMGVGKGDFVATAGRNTAHWMIGDFAASMVGAVNVGLYPKMSQEHVEFIIQHSEAKVVFINPMEDQDTVDASIPASIKRIRCPYPSITMKCDYEWDDLIAENEPKMDYQAPSDDELFGIIYTSGTTGNPKGVMINGGAIKFAMQGMLDRLGNADDERWFSYLPLAHVFERGVVAMASVYTGAQVSFLESLDKFAQNLGEVAPTRFVAVPLVWGRLQAGVLEKLPQKKLNSLLKLPIISGIIKKKIKTGLGLHNVRIAISGAAPLAPSIIEWFNELGLEIGQGYGMSENMAYCSVGVPGANRIGSVGKMLPQCEHQFSDSGELLLRHPAIMPGYYKDDAKTKETITNDGWLHTGDKGRVDDDGYLYITGRVKDLFKTSTGKYITPVPIENSLGKNAYVESLCLIGAGQKQPVMMATTSEAAHGISNEDVAASIEADVTALNAELEPAERIAKVVISRTQWSIDDGHLTPTMKVRRHFIEELFNDSVPNWYKHDELVIWH